MNAKKSFTTKLTKGTKGLEKLMIVPNFVLFVSFVVQTFVTVNPGKPLFEWE